MVNEVQQAVGSIILSLCVNSHSQSLSRLINLLYVSDDQSRCSSGVLDPIVVRTNSTFLHHLQFISRGRQLVSDGHFMANDIQEKVSVLGARRELLGQTWSDRNDIYEQSLDTQVRGADFYAVMS